MDSAKLSEGEIFIVHKIFTEKNFTEYPSCTVKDISSVSVIIFTVKLFHGWLKKFSLECIDQYTACVWKRKSTHTH